jgi:hypothetical protein
MRILKILNLNLESTMRRIASILSSGTGIGADPVGLPRMRTTPKVFSTSSFA